MTRRAGLRRLPGSPSVTWSWRSLYPRWLRMGLIIPQPIDATWTGAYKYDLSSAVVVLGVAERLSGSLVDAVTVGDVRVLAPLQPEPGACPVWGHRGYRAVLVCRESVTHPRGADSASQTADTYRITLEPRDTPGISCATSSSQPTRPTRASVLTCPTGSRSASCSEWPARAKVKEGSASRQLDRLIEEIDASIAFSATSTLFPRAGAPSPQSLRRVALAHASLCRGFPAHPSQWRWL